MKIRRIAASEIAVGQALPWDVFGNAGDLLVRAGHVVSGDNQWEMLLDRGFITDDRSIAVPKDLPSVVRLLNAAQAQLALVLERVALDPTEGDDTGAALEAVARQVVAAVDLDQEVALACILLNQDAGNYPVRHAIDVALLVLIAGRALKMTLKETHTLLLAALTMNVGMLEHHERLRNSVQPLTAHEQAYIHAHPQAGVALLQRAGIDDPAWLELVLQHHENDDGSGYPLGLSADQISESARVLALADRYCARVSARGYRAAMLPNAALRDILLEGKRSVDTRLVTLLIRELGIYPIGSYVRLLNGEIGVVTRKGLNATTPYVHALVGPRGAPLEVPSRRDTKSELHAVREVLSAAQAGITPRLEQLWGSVARA